MYGQPLHCFCIKLLCKSDLSKFSSNHCQVWLKSCFLFYCAFITLKRIIRNLNLTSGRLWKIAVSLENRLGSLNKICSWWNMRIWKGQCGLKRQNRTPGNDVLAVKWKDSECWFGLNTLAVSLITVFMSPPFPSDIGFRSWCSLHLEQD